MATGDAADSGRRDFIRKTGFAPVQLSFMEGRSKRPRSSNRKHTKYRTNSCVVSGGRKSRADHIRRRLGPPRWHGVFGNGDACSYFVVPRVSIAARKSSDG